MTRHLIACDLKGESQADWFRRIAREKPPAELPCKPCGYCGQDHRCPEEYWPAGELKRCLARRGES